MPPLLQLEAIHFRYPQREVLHHVSFEIEANTCQALIGPNGAGKTTLLRIAAGTLRPTSGTMTIAGQPAATILRKQAARLIALVPQQLIVPFDFTVQQIVEQGRSPYLGLLHGLRREDRLAVDRALALTDTTLLAQRIFNELSGGERQRVKIALGLAQEPRLLLLDEPTQNLDIGRQVELIDLLHSLRAEGLTILSSIHDLHLVPSNFSRVHLLSPEGKLTSGTPKEILTPANLTSAFHCPPGRHPLLMEPA